MKSESAGSPHPSLTAQDSAEILDFLYVDRARVSALYAQLFPQGVLTSVKTTAQQSFSDDSSVGSDIKVFKADTKSTEGGNEGIEHQFDASWSMPLDVLNELKRRGRVRTSLGGAGLGSLISAESKLRIIDFASLENLWEPGMKMFIAMGQPGAAQPVLPEVAPSIVDALKAMPRAIHAQIVTSEGFLWGSLQAASLTIPTADLTLKYGGVIDGSWQVLYLLDAWPDNGVSPDVSLWSGGAVIDSVLVAMHGLRGIIGRPGGWHGVTPLMIFRDTLGWLPKPARSEAPLNS